MTTFYTSDFHLKHRLVARLRNFGEDTEAHDAQLARNYDATVTADDIVWVLGDNTVGGKATELYGLEWFSRRPGHKRLVIGNHESIHPMHSRAHRLFKQYCEVFEYVSIVATVKIAGQRVLLSHFPEAGTEDSDHTLEPRFEEWRPRRHKDEWILHGHTHRAEQRVHGRQIHVGLDAHGLRPVHQYWIEQQIMNAEIRE